MKRKFNIHSLHAVCIGLGFIFATYATPSSAQGEVNVITFVESVAKACGGSTSLKISSDGDNISLRTTQITVDPGSGNLLLESDGVLLAELGSDGDTGYLKCVTDLSDSLGGVFVSEAQSRLGAGNLIVEFQRLTASENLSAVFKMMEGAHLALAPEHSNPGNNQYWVTDGRKNYHLVAEGFQEIWDSHQLNGRIPVGSEIWRALAADRYSQRNLVTLAATADLPENADIDVLAWRLACQEYMGDGIFGIFGSGEPYYDAAELVIGDWDGRNCGRAEFNPLQFNYTLAIIANLSTTPITNVKVTFSQPPASAIALLDTSPSRFELCDFLPWETYGAELVQARHKCTLDLISEMQSLPSQGDQSVTKGISVIRPREEIVLLLNAYVPDDTGLPGTYILGHTRIHSIRYEEAGSIFEIADPQPLAEDRLGIIRSPGGGMGGQ